MGAKAESRLYKTSAIAPWTRKLYKNAGEFWKESEGEGLHHAYLVYRALRGDYRKEFRPDGVFYVGKSPAAYLKTVQTNEISEEDVRVWQRFLWNQAVVPILIVKSRLKVRVYTAYSEPRERGSTGWIEAILDTTADAIEVEQLLGAIEAGTIYEEKPKAFRRDKGVDRYLLDNLNAAANEIARAQNGGLNEDNLGFAHSFLMRLLFVCYLIERGMIKGKDFDDERLQKIRAKSEEYEGYFLRHLFDEFNTYAQRRDLLYAVFSFVKKQFNGSLFPDRITEEKQRYNEPLIDVVNTFLHGDDLENSQLTLGFWAYDFSVIPIETISAVYEGFVGEHGKIKEASGGGDSRRKSGAYYTPPHLAELTVDIALEGIDKAVHELKVFDPACGSGVFLVCLFGRMAESLRRTKGYIRDGLCIDWARQLEPLLGKLYGLDTNPTACEITCFSLYLALLEQLTPMDVEYLRRFSKTEKALHPLLADGTHKSWNTIHQGNLFDPELKITEEGFDIVIGNPPWVSRENQKDEEFLEWIKEKPRVLGPEKQIAHGFMWKAQEYLGEAGVGCLLLPTGVFLNKNTNEFQAKWLRSVTVERVVNFADLRFVLFAGAIHPCVGVRFRAGTPDINAKIRYESPKTDVRSQTGGAVYIREEDSTQLRLREVLGAARKKEAPTIWKARFWGSLRDERLLRRLIDMRSLREYVGTPEKCKRFIMGQGCQPYTETDRRKGRKEHTPWWDDSFRFLSGRKAFDLVVNDHQDFESIPRALSVLRSSPDERIFRYPKVVSSQGSRDMKVAYCEYPVIFQHSIQAIAGGSASDREVLCFLCAVIKSDLAQYYLFHTCANWGTERDKVHFHELLSLPFFLPEDSSDPVGAQKIIEEVAEVIRQYESEMEKGGWFGREERAKEIRKELEPLVREYYGIDQYESMSIDDTLELAMKSYHPRESTTGIPTLRNPEDGECQTYAETLCEMLNHFGEGSGFKVNGEIIRGEPYSVVVVSLTDRIRKSVSISKGRERLGEILGRMQGLLEKKKGGFVLCQNLKVFDGNDLYILKPMQMRFWSRTGALNDADEIAGAILDFKG
jgi:hypothetical protein